MTDAPCLIYAQCPVPYAIRMPDAPSCPTTFLSRPMQQPSPRPPFSPLSLSFSTLRAVASSANSREMTGLLLFSSASFFHFFFYFTPVSRQEIPECELSRTRLLYSLGPPFLVPSPSPPFGSSRGCSASVFLEGASEDEVKTLVSPALACFLFALVSAIVLLFSSSSYSLFPLFRSPNSLTFSLYSSFLSFFSEALALSADGGGTSRPVASVWPVRGLPPSPPSWDG